MRLQLFDFIDEIVDAYNNDREIYENANLILINFFTKYFQDKYDAVTSVYSRVKSNESVREKLIRNKFYLKYDNVQDALGNMVDLVGLTIECRFIKDELSVYNRLVECFENHDETYYKCIFNKEMFLNLKMPQPQVQRNGFPNYRIDGFILLDNKKVNFELQIKAMVHSFWSNIEHQVVYKNTKLVTYNSLISTMLSSIKDSLDVVDNQLEIIYNQIIDTNISDKRIGVTPETFKMMVASSINELVSERMLKSVGVTTNFKQCSSMLSQYIYITEFLNAENPALKMVEYFEHLNYLRINEIDFTKEIYLEEFYHNDIFCKNIGDYWISVMNVDYEWHVFFIILFSLQPGSPIYDFKRFIETIKSLIMPKSWIKDIFKDFNKEDKNKTLNFISKIVSEIIIKQDSLSMIYEETLYNIMNILIELVNTMEKRYKNYNEILEEEQIIYTYLNRHIKALF